ncbi:MAG: hypothetical protein EXS37_04060 [Opitutus sp.]|nr:hypothetical protein [Opitutus sp.]
MLRFALIVGLASSGLTAFAASKKPEGPEVLVVSDVLASSPEKLRPTKENPVYYIVLGGAERTLGDSIAGEKMPDRAVLTQEIERAMGSQGFTLTRVGGPRPSIALLFTYGSANLSTVDLNDTDATTGETTTSTIAFNRREIAQLVGALKADRHLLMSSEADRINEAARDDRLYILVAAFDVDALVKKQRKLLWRTRISISSRRQSLPDAMRVMLASAAPYFATETDLPQFIEDADRRKAEVLIGTPTVVEEPAAGAAKVAPKKK